MTPMLTDVSAASLAGAAAARCVYRWLCSGLGYWATEQQKATGICSRTHGIAVGRQGLGNTSIRRLSLRCCGTILQCSTVGLICRCRTIALCLTTSPRQGYPDMKRLCIFAIDAALTVLFACAASGCYALCFVRQTVDVAETNSSPAANFAG